MNSLKISDIQPFKMHGNIYFIGSSRVSVHLIDTECGLVLIDTGYPDMYDQILYSMKSLGFNPYDICAIFHSHGHIDHFGCTLKLKELSGAKTYISRIDNEITNGTLNLSYADEIGLEKIIFNCDVLVEDGDTYTFGKTSIKCRLTPGHTDGTLSFFINIPDNDGTITAAMHGGIGTNTLAMNFLNKYNLPFKSRDIFRKGLHSLYEEHVDLVLGNHPYQNDTVGKLQKIQSGNSILDIDEWKQLLIYAEDKLDKRIQAES
ncbi:MAG: MBL fold metallo-hydrolase [Clostridia bacterium]|nr:MBL fold metallo-hydrolase [Clostridia bacterium]